MTLFLRSLAIASLAMGVTFAAVAEAGVVYGNLGAAGTNPIGSTNTDYGPSDAFERVLAQGFQVGSSATSLDLQSVTVGLFATNSGSVPLSVAIYGDAAGQPGSLLHTSGTVNVGNTGTYTFPFTGVSLSTETSYWVVPQGGASWYLDATNTTPGGQNGSGYSYLGTLRQLPDLSWTTPNPNLTSYSVSINAVPEPHAFVLAGVGIATAVALVRRRRG